MPRIFLLGGGIGDQNYTITELESGNFWGKFFLGKTIKNLFKIFLWGFYVLVRGVIPLITGGRVQHVDKYRPPSINFIKKDCYFIKQDRCLCTHMFE